MVITGISGVVLRQKIVDINLIQENVLERLKDLSAELKPKRK